MIVPYYARRRQSERRTAWPVVLVLEGHEGCRKNGITKKEVPVQLDLTKKESKMSVPTPLALETYLVQPPCRFRTTASRELQT